MARKIISLHERQIGSLTSIGFAAQRFNNYRDTAADSFHGHDILEMNFIVRGNARHRIGGMIRDCPPGSLGIIHYGQAHDLVTDDDGIDVINLYLDPANHALPQLPAEFSEIVGALFPPAVMPGIPAGLCSFLHFKEHEPIASLLTFCCSEQEAMRPGYEAVLESALRIFLIACARQALADGVQTLAADPSRWQLLEGVRLRLERTFTRPQKLADLAREVGISPEHLCRRFKAYTGLSPFAYLAQCRVRAAMQELRNSNRSVLDIALSVGFNDVGHFNRKFRHFANYSPTEYRRNMRR